MALDSRVAFQQRAVQCGVPQAGVDELETNRITTFAQFAFCCAYHPGAQDDTPLLVALEGYLGARPQGAAAATYRRLFFKSHALALQDLKNRMERTESSEAKILPLSEKVERIRRLKDRLQGILITQALEPSHALIDKVVQQYEENSLRFIELHSCTSREQEILAEKADPQLTFDASGNIKVTKKQQVTECSLTGDLRLRQAFQRRALAYELAGIATFNKMEYWANMLFERMQADPPVGYRHVSADQIIRADRALWLKIAEETRAQVATTVDGVKPVDAAIDKWSIHPEVQFHFLPLPSGAASTSTSSASKPESRPAKPSPLKPHQNPAFEKTKGKGKGKSGFKSAHKIEVPPDCEIKWGNSHKPICMKFNIGTCKANIRAGKRCQYGYHVCGKKGCHKTLPATECTHN